jgi:phage repressor protein C with HTH and peptisase S24 domain
VPYFAAVHGEFTVFGVTEGKVNSTNVDLGNRLKEERQRLGLTQGDFGAKLGVSKTSQFNYEAGDRVPDADYLQRALSLGVDVLYVLTGNRLEDLDDEFVVIPHFEVTASAGNGAVNSVEVSHGGLSFSKKWLTSKGLSPKSLRVIDVVGDSMQPRLSDGDKVLVDTTEKTPKSGRAYVLLQGDELLVKFCQLLPDGILRVSSANPEYPTYDIDLSRTAEVSIVGRVRASTHEW